MTSFTINSKTLTAAIKPMLTLMKGSRIPVLHGIHVTVDEGAIRLAATDLEVAIIRTLDAATTGTATYVIANAKLFSQCIGKGNVTVTFEADKITVTSGASTVRLDALKAEAYPVIPVVPQDATFAMLQADHLVSLVKHTSYAISPEESRFTLNGALLKVVGGEATMVTTDGHRLAVAKAIVDAGSAIIGNNAIVPRLTLETITKVFSGPATIYITRGEERLWFQSGSTTVVSRVLSGSFPDYERVLPKDNGYSLVIERKPFLDALTRADKHADIRSHQVKLTLNGACKITASVDGTEYVESVPAHWDGLEDWDASFNARYLMDFLKTQTAETVCVQFAGKPIVKRNKGGEVISTQNWESSAIDCYGDLGTRTIVMPMRA